jgi:hypothetical protein
VRVWVKLDIVVNPEVDPLDGEATGGVGLLDEIAHVGCDKFAALKLKSLICIPVINN